MNVEKPSGRAQLISPEYIQERNPITIVNVEKLSVTSLLLDIRKLIVKVNPIGVMTTGKLNSF